MEPFIYIDEEKDLLVLIPEGYVSDGNSVPKPFQGYFGRWEVPEAGVVHDWLYDHPGAYLRLSTGLPGAPLSKLQCDNVHRRILALQCIRFTKCALLYGILILFGWLAWRRHRTQDASEPI